MPQEKDIKILIESTTYEVEASLFGDDVSVFDEISEEDIKASLEPETMSMKTFGTFGVDGDRAQVAYEESEATGMEGSKTAVSFDIKKPGLVTMMRTGVVSTALVFEKGKRHHCVYKTPYMPFEICVKTLDVKNHIMDTGRLELDYIIEIRGAKAERTKFSMKIAE